MCCCDGFAVEVEARCEPVILRGFAVSLKNIVCEVERVGCYNLSASQEELWVLDRGWSGFEIVSRVVDAVELSVAGGFSPVVDDVVAEVCVHRTLKTWIASEVMREEIVVPCDAVAADDGGVSVMAEVESLAEDAPLNGDSVCKLCGGEDLVGGPA